MIRVKKPFRAILLLVATIAILASCASKPKAAAPEPEPAPVAEAPAQPAAEPQAAPAIGQDELDKLLAEAKGLKKKAFDLKLFEVLPDDYKAADALFAKGQQSYDAKDAAAAKEGLDAAISAYKGLIAKGVVEIAAAKRKEAEDMKANSDKAGAFYKEAERYEAGDESFAKGSELVDRSDSEAAISAYERARLYYELAWKRSIAGDLKGDIEARDYAQWDSGNYQLADTKFKAEEGFWASGKDAERASGVDALDEAVLRFNLVLQKGRETAVTIQKNKADEAKRRSEGIKANVAVKDAYEAALDQYNVGVSSLAAKDYEAAIDAFDRAGSDFEQAYEAAAEKRAAAETAMKTAEEATAESQRKAEEAEPLLQSITAE